MKPREQAVMDLIYEKQWFDFSLRRVMSIRGSAQYAIVIENDPLEIIFRDVTLDDLEEWADTLPTVRLCCFTQAEAVERHEAWKLAYISPSKRNTKEQSK